MSGWTTGFMMAVGLVAIPRTALSQPYPGDPTMKEIGHVRARHQVLPAMITTATARSLTLRRMVETITASDGLVKVEPIAAADPREATIVLHVVNSADLSRDVLNQARDRVAKVYAEVPRAEPLEPLTIEVVTVNQARIPRETVKRAERVATRIFLAAGIRLEWTNTAPDSVEPYRETAQQLKIHIVPDSSKKQAGRRLGVAERLVDNSDRRAFVFYNRMVDLARMYGVDIAPILGHALAHEMGHVLLPYGSHTSQGIMREEWDRAQFQAMAKGILTFTDQHTDLIRMRVRAMHGD